MHFGYVGLSELKKIIIIQIPIIIIIIIVFFLLKVLILFFLQYRYCIMIKYLTNQISN